MLGYERRAALTARQSAVVYSLSKTTIRDAIRAGELPAFRIGKRRLLILRQDLEQWLRKHQVRPSAHAEQTVRDRLEHEATTL